MTVDAAAGRAAGRVLGRAYARTARTMRKDHGLDVAAGLHWRDSRKTVAIVSQDMTGNLIGYVLIALLAGAPVLVVSAGIRPWLVRYVLTAVVAVPAAVPLAALVMVQVWAVSYAWRARRDGQPPRLGPADVEALLARGGLAAWRLALVLGLVAALTISWVPAP